MIIMESYLYRHYRVIVEHLISAMITKINFGYGKGKSLDKLLDECINELKLRNGERKIIISEVEKLIGKEKNEKGIWRRN